MNCYYCQSPCEKFDRNSQVILWCCDKHPYRIDHLCILRDNQIILDVLEMMIKKGNKNYRVSLDNDKQYWEIHEVYGFSWNDMYTTILQSQEHFPFTPENVEEKLDLMLTFL